MGFDELYNIARSNDDTEAIANRAVSDQLGTVNERLTASELQTALAEAAAAAAESKAAAAESKANEATDKANEATDKANEAKDIADSNAANVLNSQVVANNARWETIALNKDTDTKTFSTRDNNQIPETTVIDPPNTYVYSNDLKFELIESPKQSNIKLELFSDSLGNSVFRINESDEDCVFYKNVNYTFDISTLPTGNYKILKIPPNIQITLAGSFSGTDYTFTLNGNSSMIFYKNLNYTFDPTGLGPYVHYMKDENGNILKTFAGGDQPIEFGGDTLQPGNVDYTFTTETNVYFELNLQGITNVITNSDVLDNPNILTTFARGTQSTGLFEYTFTDNSATSVYFDIVDTPQTVTLAGSFDGNDYTTTLNGNVSMIFYKNPNSVYTFDVSGLGQYEYFMKDENGDTLDTFIGGYSNNNFDYTFTTENKVYFGVNLLGITNVITKSDVNGNVVPKNIQLNDLSLYNSGLQVDGALKIKQLETIRNPGQRSEEKIDYGFDISRDIYLEYCEIKESTLDIYNDNVSQEAWYPLPDEPKRSDYTDKTDQEFQTDVLDVWNANLELKNNWYSTVFNDYIESVKNELNLLYYPGEGNPYIYKNIPRSYEFYGETSYGGITRPFSRAITLVYFNSTRKTLFKNTLVYLTDFYMTETRLSYARWEHLIPIDKNNLKCKLFTPGGGTQQADDNIKLGNLNNESLDINPRLGEISAISDKLKAAKMTKFYVGTGPSLNEYMRIFAENPGLESSIILSQFTKNNEFLGIAFNDDYTRGSIVESVLVKTHRSGVITNSDLSTFIDSSDKFEITFSDKFKETTEETDEFLNNNDGLFQNDRTFKVIELKDEVGSESTFKKYQFVDEFDAPIKLTYINPRIYNANKIIGERFSSFNIYSTPEKLKINRVNKVVTENIITGNSVSSIDITTSNHGYTPGDRPTITVSKGDVDDVEAVVVARMSADGTSLEGVEIIKGGNYRNTDTTLPTVNIDPSPTGVTPEYSLTMTSGKELVTSENAIDSLTDSFLFAGHDYAIKWKPFGLLRTNKVNDAIQKIATSASATDVSLDLLNIMRPISEPKKNYSVSFDANNGIKIDGELNKVLFLVRGETYTFTYDISGKSFGFYYKGAPFGQRTENTNIDSGITTVTIKIPGNAPTKNIYYVDTKNSAAFKGTVRTFFGNPFDKSLDYFKQSVMKYGLKFENNEMSSPPTDSNGEEKYDNVDAIYTTPAHYLTEAKSVVKYNLENLIIQTVPFVSLAGSFNDTDYTITLNGNSSMTFYKNRVYTFDPTSLRNFQYVMKDENDNTLKTFIGGSDDENSQTGQFTYTFTTETSVHFELILTGYNNMITTSNVIDYTITLAGSFGGTGGTDYTITLDGNSSMIFYKNRAYKFDVAGLDQLQFVMKDENGDTLHTFTGGNANNSFDYIFTTENQVYFDFETNLPNITNVITKSDVIDYPKLEKGRTYRFETVSQDVFSSFEFDLYPGIDYREIRFQNPNPGENHFVQITVPESSGPILKVKEGETISFIRENPVAEFSKAFRYTFNSDNTMDIFTSDSVNGVVNGVADSVNVYPVLSGIPWVSSPGKISFPDVFNFDPDIFALNYNQGVLDPSLVYYITGAKYHPFTYSGDKITFTRPPTFTFTPNTNHPDYNDSVVIQYSDDTYVMQQAGNVYDIVIDTGSSLSLDLVKYNYIINGDVTVKSFETTELTPDDVNAELLYLTNFLNLGLNYEQFEEFAHSQTGKILINSAFGQQFSDLLPFSESLSNENKIYHPILIGETGQQNNIYTNFEFSSMSDIIGKKVYTLGTEHFKNFLISYGAIEELDPNKADLIEYISPGIDSKQEWHYRSDITFRYIMDIETHSPIFLLIKQTLWDSLLLSDLDGTDRKIRQTAIEKAAKDSISKTRTHLRILDANYETNDLKLIVGNDISPDIQVAWKEWSAQRYRNLNIKTAHQDLPHKTYSQLKTHKKITFIWEYNIKNGQHGNVSDWITRFNTAISNKTIEGLIAIQYQIVGDKVYGYELFDSVLNFNSYLNRTLTRTDLARPDGTPIDEELVRLRCELDGQRRSSGSLDIDKPGYAFVYKAFRYNTGDEYKISSIAQRLTKEELDNL